MDPISTAIVTALAKGVGEVGKKLIMDSYEALKSALRRKCGQESEVVEAVEKLEKKPESKGRLTTLQEEVQTAQLAEDAELKQLAEALLKALKDTPEGRAAMSKYRVEAENIGVVGDNAHIESGIKFSS